MLPDKGDETLVIGRLSGRFLLSLGSDAERIDRPRGSPGETGFRRAAGLEPASLWGMNSSRGRARSETRTLIHRLNLEPVYEGLFPLILLTKGGPEKPQAPGR
jgi:hypothetical protein